MERSRACGSGGSGCAKGRSEPGLVVFRENDGQGEGLPSLIEMFSTMFMLSFGITGSLFSTHCAWVLCGTLPCPKLRSLVHCNDCLRMLVPVALV